MLSPIISIKVTHLGVYADGRPNTSSIYIPDLDTSLDGLQSMPGHRVPVYVPFGGFISIPLTSRSLFSYTTGALAKLVEAGLVRVDLINPTSSPTGESVQVVNVNSGAELENGSWDFPWKSIQKALNSCYGNFDDPVPAGPTLPDQRRTILVCGGTYDEDLVIPVAGGITLLALGVISIGTTPSPRSITRVVDPALNPDAPRVPTLILTSEITGGAFILHGDLTLSDTNGVQFQNLTLNNAAITGDFDASAQTADCIVGVENVSFQGSVWNAPTARLDAKFCRWSASTPVFKRLDGCVHNRFDLGFTLTSILAGVVLMDTRVAGTVTSPVNPTVDFITNQWFATNAVTKAGGWAATIPFGRTVAY